MDIIKKKFKIVISRYNEDLNWLIPFKDISIVYNKGEFNPILNHFEVIKLPNYGRESNTYLKYIIENYDNLAEYNIFFQGNISDHPVLTIEDYLKDNDFNGNIKYISIDLLKNPIKHFGKWKNEINSNKMKISNLTTYEWLTKFVGLNIDNQKTVGVVWGAVFSASKSIIKKKPVEFYKYLLRFVNFHYNPEEGHFFERSWYLIFHNKFVSKKKIGYFNIKKNFKYKKNISDIKKLFENSDYHIVHIWNNYNENDNFKYNHIPKNRFIKLNNIIKNNIFDFSIVFNSTMFLKIEFNDDDYYLLVLNLTNNESILYLNQKILFKTKDYNFISNNIYNIYFKIDKEILIKINNSNFYHNINNFSNFEVRNKYIKFLNNDNEIMYKNDNNIRYFLKDHDKFNLEEFYCYYYLDYYVEEINIVDYI